MQIAEPAGYEGCPRQLDSSVKVLCSSSIIFPLSLQIAKTTENIDSLSSSPAAACQSQRFQQHVSGETEMTTISKKVSVLPQRPGENVVISLLLGVLYRVD